MEGTLARRPSHEEVRRCDGTVPLDNQCDFGEWLYGSELEPADKEDVHYCDVKKLHAEFHKEAAKVVEWATSGQPDKAEESLALGGAYAKASQVQTEATVRWRQSLQMVRCPSVGWNSACAL